MHFHSVEDLGETLVSGVGTSRGLPALTSAHKEEVQEIAGLAVDAPGESGGNNSVGRGDKGRGAKGIHHQVKDDKNLKQA